MPSSHCGAAVMNPTRICEDSGSILGLALWTKDLGVAVSCNVGHRHNLDPALLWLWCRPAAVAPIRPLAWELLYAVGVALKSKKKKKKKPKTKKKKKKQPKTKKQKNKQANDLNRQFSK